MKNYRLLFVLMALLLASLACNLPAVQPRNATPAVVTEEPLATPGLGFLPPLTGTEVPSEAPATEAPAAQPTPGANFAIKVKTSRGGIMEDVVKASDVETTLTFWGDGLKAFPYEVFKAWSVERGITSLTVVHEIHSGENHDNMVVYLPDWVTADAVLALATKTNTIGALIYAYEGHEVMCFAPRSDLPYKRGQLYDVPQGEKFWTLPAELACPESK